MLVLPGNHVETELPGLKELDHQFGTGNDFLLFSLFLWPSFGPADVHPVFLCYFQDGGDMYQTPIPLLAILILPVAVFLGILGMELTDAAQQDAAFLQDVPLLIGWILSFDGGTGKADVHPVTVVGGNVYLFLLYTAYHHL